MKILVTCPPMLGMQEQFLPILKSYGGEATCPEVIQTLDVAELERIVPEHDGWIIGDDPATESVFRAGKKGRLKAAVKWGIGVDNVDFQACRELEIPITNTPGMFGDEVADIALGYVIGLARELFFIDREIRKGGWPKPRGNSLRGKMAAVVGYGDIGSKTANRLASLGMKVICYDPAIQHLDRDDIELVIWPERIEECDYLIFTCALNVNTFHMLDETMLGGCKPGVSVVNVARGALIDENALMQALKNGHVRSAALDVFEIEPLPANSYLREHPQCIFGSHNSSNTSEAVARTNLIAIEKLMGFLGRSK